MKIIISLVFIYLINGIASGPSKSKNNHKMILILADGIRYDYVNDKNLTGFSRMASNGVRAEYVQPIFPANSYPNWYTIVTGLYGESHGMVQNFMYDPKEQDTFLMSPHPNASHAHWWNEAEPLWITAEKNDLKTAVYWWDGCQVPQHGVEPTLCLEYQSYWTWPKPNEDTLEALNEILDNFENEEWRLALVYYEAVDAMGHAFGSESQERVEAMQDLDKILTSLQDEIEKRKLQDEVNVIVVSDHGMIEVDEYKKTKIIDIEKIVNASDVHVMLDRGTTSFLIPNPGREEQVLESLKRAKIDGLNFYKKDDIPLKYHIKNHRRVAPIVLVASRGYFVRGFSQDSKTKPVWDVLYGGHHGYDPYDVKEMRTIMFGRGPGIKKNVTAQPLMMTDHYNLFCYLLGIEARPNNGTWNKVKDITIDSGAKASQLIKNSAAFGNTHSGETCIWSINSLILFIVLKSIAMLL